MRYITLYFKSRIARVQRSALIRALQRSRSSASASASSARAASSPLASIRLPGVCTLQRLPVLKVHLLPGAVPPARRAAARLGAAAALAAAGLGLALSSVVLRWRGLQPGICTAAAARRAGRAAAAAYAAAAATAAAAAAYAAASELVVEVDARVHATGLE